MLCAGRSFLVAGQMSKVECQAIHSILGDTLTPTSCQGLISPVDKFDDEKSQTHHRNSWLWPKFARRRTKKADGSFHEQHPSNWQTYASVTGDQCEAIKAALKEKLGDKAAEKYPDACK